MKRHDEEWTTTVMTPYTAHVYLTTHTKDMDEALDFLVAWENGEILSSPRWRAYREWATGVPETPPS